MESNELITIIIPCYNYAHYLPECVESIRKQSYKNIEFFVVNDGSTDNTEEVCKKLGVKFYTKINGGLASARNHGIKKAKGKYIMCLDADDILPLDSIKDHMSLAGDKVISQLGMLEFGDRNNLYFPSGATLNSLFQGNSIYCNSVFPRQEFFDVGGYDESEIMRLGYEDWEFWVRLMANGCKLKSMEKVGLYYRIHGASMTKTTVKGNQHRLHEYIVNKNKHLLDERK